MNRKDRQALHDLLDGALSPEEAAALRRRAAEDAELGATLARLEATQRSLKSLRTVATGPRPFIVPTKSPARSWRWLWSALPVVATAAALVVGVSWWSSRAPLEVEASERAVAKHSERAMGPASAAERRGNPPDSLHFSAAEAPGVAVELKFVAPEAGQVQVAGDFNGWRPEPLHREGDRWAARLRLPPGRYAYMYVVDGRWTSDPQAHSFRDDEFGRQNAVLHL
jgi:anti-sigma factor RsiW